MLELSDTQSIEIMDGAVRQGKECEGCRQDFKRQRTLSASLPSYPGERTHADLFPRDRAIHR
jgi:hypothetical protein